MRRKFARATPRLSGTTMSPPPCPLFGSRVPRFIPLQNLKIGPAGTGRPRGGPLKTYKKKRRGENLVFLRNSTPSNTFKKSFRSIETFKTSLSIFLGGRGTLKLFFRAGGPRNQNPFGTSGGSKGLGNGGHVSGFARLDPQAAEISIPRICGRAFGHFRPFAFFQIF